jgi:hypothetical protein
MCTRIRQKLFQENEIMADELDKSENISKKLKRGRPRLSDYLPEINALTVRGRQNYHYMVRAMRVLGNGDDPRFFWLCDANAVNAGKAGVKFVILSELGRVRDDGELVELAELICELKPTTKKAMSIIKEVRGAKRKGPSALDLANEVITTMNGYTTRHPNVTKDQQLDALETVVQIVNKSAD